MTTRFLACLVACVVLLSFGPADAAAPVSAPAYRALAALLQPAAPPPGRCLPAACRLVVADDGDVVVPDVCDATLQSQCLGDCSAQRMECETGHDDSLPCEANYTTCTANCTVISGCGG